MLSCICDIIIKAITGGGYSTSKPRSDAHLEFLLHCNAINSLSKILHLRSINGSLNSIKLKIFFLKKLLFILSASFMGYHFYCVSQFYKAGISYMGACLNGAFFYFKYFQYIFFFNSTSFISAGMFDLCLKFMGGFLYETN